MIIDIHHHYVPERFIDAVRTDGARYNAVVYTDQPTGLLALTVGSTEEPPPRPLGRSFWAMEPGFYDLDRRLEDLDEMELDMAALSPSPLLYYYSADPDVGLEVAQLANDAIHEAATKYPDRFVPMGTVPLQDIDKALAELDRIVSEYGFTSVEIGGNVNGRNLDEPEFDAFFQRAAELDLLIYMHPVSNPAPDRLQRYYTENIIAFPVETAIFTASIIFGGTLKRYPDLKLCLAHGGGVTPSIIERWDHAWTVREECRVAIDESPSTYFNKLYFDDLVHGDKTLANLINMVGTSQILAGTDYIYDMGQYPPKARIDNANLDHDEREDIRWRTAARLLRMEDRFADAPAGEESRGGWRSWAGGDYRR